MTIPKPAPLKNTHKHCLQCGVIIPPDYYYCDYCANNSPTPESKEPIKDRWGDFCQCEICKKHWKFHKPVEIVCKSNQPIQ